MLTKDLVELLKFLKEVYDERTGERFAETMDAIADTFNEAAMRALEDATRRHGDARKQKLQLALSHLDIAYSAQSWITNDDPQTVRHRRRHPRESLDKMDSACQLALIIASVYGALGNDEQSVLEWIRRCRDVVACWNRLNASMDWSDTAIEPGTLVSSWGVAMADLRLRGRTPEAVKRELERRQQHDEQIASVIQIIRGDVAPDAVWGERARTATGTPAGSVEHRDADVP